MTMVQGRSSVLFAVTALAAVALGLYVAEESSATHYWSASLHWEPAVGPDPSVDSAIRLHGYASFDTDYHFGTCSDAQPGMLLMAPGETLTVGGAPVSYFLRVDYVDSAAGGHCRYAGHLADAAGQAGVVVVVDGSELAVLEGCCRKDNAPHVNNPNQEWSVQTLLVPDGTHSPVVDFPHTSRFTDHGSQGYGLHHCPTNALCRWYIEAHDPDNDVLSWRLSTGTESGSSSFQHPSGLSVDSRTGLVTWDTRSTKVGELYSTQIVVEDGITRSSVDFMIEIVPGCENGQYATMDPATGMLVCDGPVQPPTRCEANPDDDGCRPFQPPPPGKRDGSPSNVYGRFVPPVQLEPVPSVEDDAAPFRDRDAVGVDQDEDGLDDHIDLCPAHADPDNSDIDGDGRAAPCDDDDDNDGLIDPMDACPTDPDVHCGLDPQAKDEVEGKQVARGFFQPDPEPAREAAHVQVASSDGSGGFTPLLLVLGIAMLALIGVFGRRRR